MVKNIQYTVFACVNMLIVENQRNLAG